MFSDYKGDTQAVRRRMYTTNGFVADIRDVAYDATSGSNFAGVLSPHYCYVVANTIGPIECLRQCTSWSGRRCFGFAYNNINCCMCDYSVVPNEVPATSVAEQANVFWLSEGRHMNIHIYKCNSVTCFSQ